MCRWLVIALEVAAVTTVAEIPVHVTQKRIRLHLLVLILRLSPCPWHLGCLGPVTEFVVIIQGHLGTS